MGETTQPTWFTQHVKKFKRNLHSLAADHWTHHCCVFTRNTIRNPLKGHCSSEIIFHAISRTTVLRGGNRFKPFWNVCSASFTCFHCEKAKRFLSFSSLQNYVGKAFNFWAQKLRISLWSIILPFARWLVLCTETSVKDVVGSLRNSQRWKLFCLLNPFKITHSTLLYTVLPGNWAKIQAQYGVLLNVSSIRSFLCSFHLELRCSTYAFR